MTIGASIDAFEAAVEREAAACLGDVSLLMKRIVGDTVKELIGITPVDTGHAKANWLVGLDLKPSAEVSLFDASPVGVSSGPTLQAAMDVIAGITLNTKVVYIVNNAHYISWIVEDGHSLQVAPGEFSAALQRLQTKL